MLLSSGLIADMSWHMENDVTPGNYVDLIGKPHRHLETGKEIRKKSYCMSRASLHKLLLRNQKDYRQQRTW